MWGGFDKAATSVFPPCFPALYKWSRKCPNEEYRWESHYVSWGSHYHCMWGEVLYLWVTWREKHSQLITALRASSTADWSLTNPWRSWISEPPHTLLEPVCKWGKSVNEASLWPLFYYVHLIMDLGYLWKRERKSFIVHCSPSRPLTVPLCYLFVHFLVDNMRWLTVQKIFIWTSHLCLLSTCLFVLKQIISTCL